MTVDFTRKFQKQIADCKDRRIKSRVLALIEDVTDAESMTGFVNLKKLTGYKNRYRIRIGNYRVGVVIDGNLVVFAAFDHRASIYKYFP